MTEIGFYHLTRSSAEAALAPLLGRTLAAGRRAVVRCADPARVASVDSALWEAAEPIWLPHGTPAGGDATFQPIWITADEQVPNQASYLFLLDGRLEPDAARFERIFDLFDGGDPAAVAAARTRWSDARSAGHTLAYWKQEPKGWIRAG